jgi:hypothetical protein
MPILAPSMSFGEAPNENSAQKMGSFKRNARILGLIPLECNFGAVKIRVNSPLFEIAHVLVRLDHVARFIVNANHGIV